MSAMAVKIFNVSEFVKTSKELGQNEDLAYFQAHVIEKIANVIDRHINEQQFEIGLIKSREAATKGDVRESELRLQKEIEIVRKQQRESELALQKEIEVVRKDIEIVRSEIRGLELSLLKEIEIVRKEASESVLGLNKEIELVRCGFRANLKGLELKLMFVYGGGFFTLLGVLAKGFHWL